MNQAHWHLLVNHFPIILPIVGLLIMIGGLFFRSEILKRTAYLLFIGGAIFAFAAMQTGEGAEEVVEQMGAVQEQYVETHEETAKTFAILSYILGLIALIGIWTSLKRKALGNVIAFVTIAFSLVNLYFAQETGTTGGEIRHTEIREDERSNTSDGTKKQENGEGEHE